ncbi:DUF4833 domain-containing protein [Dyadobacter chenhuakuii]|uniref:DUF4833 domain-containing protein n=1 Tax=Dyadobacter chenhuakuii TaxID=2909339 RepID=A0A9X1QA91_9BACT|nr:DUF4833 domain-containing protein [Dyadobacter chenhuakuii]MCF2496728.1 DUF4833 domain-containing protein [Dyadobacter chenhuakuii]
MKTIILTGLLSITHICEQPLPGRPILGPQMQDSLPVPHDIPNLLFYLQRDGNANTICYTLNLGKSGELNINNPIKMFWVMYAEKGAHKELNFLQKRYAYGINVYPQGKDSYEIKTVSYPSRSLFLRKNIDNQFQVFTNINNQHCTLKRVFIRIDGGTPLSPHIKHIELHGIELTSSKTAVEIVKVS